MSSYEPRILRFHLNGEWVTIRMTDGFQVYIGGNEVDPRQLAALGFSCLTYACLDMSPEQIAQVTQANEKDPELTRFITTQEDMVLRRALLRSAKVITGPLTKFNSEIET